MKNRAKDRRGIGDFADIHQQVRHRYWMIDVGNRLFAFARLKPMLVSGEGQGLEEQSRFRQLFTHDAAIPEAQPEPDCVCSIGRKMTIYTISCGSATV